MVLQNRVLRHVIDTDDNSTVNENGDLLSLEEREGFVFLRKIYSQFDNRRYLMLHLFLALNFQDNLPSDTVNDSDVVVLASISFIAEVEFLPGTSTNSSTTSIINCVPDFIETSFSNVGTRIGFVTAILPD